MKNELGRDMNEALRKVIKRFHYPLEVMLVCVRWYVAYPLSLRQLEEMMSERGVGVDHSTLHRWCAQDFTRPDHGVSAAQAPSESQLAHGRDLHPGGRAAEIPLPSGGQDRADG